MEKPFDKKYIESLYEEYNTPEHVKAHCKGVCDAAMAMGTALNRAGLNLDINVIYSAAIVHDAARIYPDHGEVVAQRLRQEGYDHVADIVQVHMRYDGFKYLNKINETDIVALADRIVKEDKYVGLDERIEYIIDKAGRTPEVEKRLYAKKKETQKFIDKIEAIVGMGIDDIVNNYLGELND